MGHPHDEEWLDLVDQEDQVVKRVIRSGLRDRDASLSYRVINAFLVNSRGEIWIPRRTAEKRQFPLCLDMSVGGHVSSGETYEETFRRETAEELNLDIEKADYKLLARLSPFEHGVSAFMNVYEIRQDTAPDFNKNDFLEYFWLTPREFFERVRAGDKAKGDLPILVERFYGRE